MPISKPMQSWMLVAISALIHSYTVFRYFYASSDPASFAFAKGTLAAPAVLIGGLGVYIAVKDKLHPLKNRFYFRMVTVVLFLTMVIYFPR